MSIPSPFTLKVVMLIVVCIAELNVDIMTIDMCWVNLLGTEEKNGKIDEKGKTVYTLALWEILWVEPQVSSVWVLELVLWGLMINQIESSCIDIVYKCMVDVAVTQVKDTISFQITTCCYYCRWCIRIVEGGGGEKANSVVISYLSRIWFSYVLLVKNFKSVLQVAFGHICEVVLK